MSNYWITISSVFLFCFVTLSHANDDFIEEIARREKATVEEVRIAIDEGCSSGITTLMNQCAHYLWVDADIQLNRAYSALMKKLGTKGAKEKLIKAQRAWLTYRDSTCEYEKDGWSDGSGYTALYLGCLKFETEERTSKLNEYINCEDACPGTGFE